MTNNEINNEVLNVYEIDENNPKFMDKMKRDFKTPMFEDIGDAIHSGGTLLAASLLTALPIEVALNNANRGLTGFAVTLAATAGAVLAIRGAVKLFETTHNNITELAYDKLANEAGKKTLTNKDLDVSIRDAVKIRETIQKTHGVSNTPIFEDDAKFQELSKKFKTEAKNKDTRNRISRTNAIYTSVSTIGKIGR
jgi:hypothetical protein